MSLARRIAAIESTIRSRHHGLLLELLTEAELDALILCYDPDTLAWTGAARLSTEGEAELAYTGLVKLNPRHREQRKIGMSVRTYLNSTRGIT